MDIVGLWYNGARVPLNMLDRLCLAKSGFAVSAVGGGSACFSARNWSIGLCFVRLTSVIVLPPTFNGSIQDVVGTSSEHFLSAVLGHDVAYIVFGIDEIYFQCFLFQLCSEVMVSHINVFCSCSNLLVLNQKYCSSIVFVYCCGLCASK